MVELSHDNQPGREADEDKIEASALSDRLGLRELVISEQQTQTANDIREHCKQLRKELADVPLTALRCNLSYPKMSFDDYATNYSAYAEMHLPLVRLGSEFPGYTLSIDLKNSELVSFLGNEKGNYIWPSVFERITKPATNEMICEAAGFFARGGLEGRLERLRETAKAEQKELRNGAKRVPLERYKGTTRTLIDALTHVVSETQPSPEEDHQIRKAVAKLLGDLGEAARRNIFVPEPITFGFFPGLLNGENADVKRNQSELRQALARGIWLRTRGSQK